MPQALSSRPRPFDFLASHFRSNYQALVRKAKLAAWADPDYRSPTFPLEEEGVLARGRQKCFYCLRYEEQLQEHSFKKLLQHGISSYRNLVMISFIQIVDTLKRYEDWELRVLMEHLVSFLGSSTYLSYIRFYGVILLQVYLDDPGCLDYLLEVNLVEFLTAKFGQALIRQGVHPFLLTASAGQKLFMREGNPAPHSRSRVEREPAKSYPSLKALSKASPLVLLEPFWHQMSKTIYLEEVQLTPALLFKRFGAKSLSGSKQAHEAHDLVHVLMVLLEVAKRKEAVARQMAERSRSVQVALLVLVDKYTPEDSELMHLRRQKIVLLLKLLRRMVKALPHEPGFFQPLASKAMAQFQYYLVQIQHYNSPLRRNEFLVHLAETRYAPLYELRQLAILLSWAQDEYLLDRLYPSLLQFMNLQLIRSRGRPPPYLHGDFINALKKLQEDELRELVFSGIFTLIKKIVSTVDDRKAAKLLFSGLEQFPKL